MTAPSRYLLDSNILARYADRNSPHHTQAFQAVTALLRSGAVLHIAPQNLYEFWNVATRPVTANGLGFSVHETAALLESFKNAFTLLPETAAVFEQWECLVQTHSVIGKQVHDCRLVAFMQVHSLTHLLTFNAADFRRFEASETIVVAEPSAIALLRNGDAS